MSWLTKAKKIENFQDRNLTLEAIRKLTPLSDYLAYAADLVYMTARGAKSMVAAVRTNKTLSIYSDVQDILRDADLIALDSPKRFATMCQAASKSIQNIIMDLEHDLHIYNTKTGPNKFQKGWIDNE